MSQPEADERLNYNLFNTSMKVKLWQRKSGVHKQNAKNDTSLLSDLYDVFTTIIII